MASHSTVTSGLKCRECGKAYPEAPVHVCEFCFGPLEVSYDYAAAAKTLSRRSIERRPHSMWRYHELLPLQGEPRVGTTTGFTPLVRAKNLGDALGLNQVYVKNDAVCSPTLSFKDRVVSVAHSKAIEFGFKVVACASTGNLANSVAANASAARLECYVFIPADLERGKVLGTSVYGAHVVGILGAYDEVNRLCSEIAGKYGWAFVNINIRPYYSEGSKSFGFEIAEQLDWRLPDHVVVPMAGGSLITKIGKAFKEFTQLGLVRKHPVRIHGSQAAGCSPIVTAIKDGTTVFKPVKKPETIAKSLAIGNPADGFYAMKTIRESHAWAENPTDDEIVWGMKILAQTEGIFGETAAGVTVAGAHRLAKAGKIGKDEVVVISVTGNGLKTQEAIAEAVDKPVVIPPSLREFDEALKQGLTPPDQAPKAAAAGR
ncbi:MAG: threonine synthase [Nitrospirae bacterium]|nr:threonine synthase [Nitrospirota bacterium]